MAIETQDEGKHKLVEDTINTVASLSKDRANFESHWQDVAHFVWPEMRNTFNPVAGNFELQGNKKTQLQLDATPQIALDQFGAILDSLLTPRNQTWHSIVSDNEDLNKVRAVSLWFGKLNTMLFKYRYAPDANFASQNQLQYKGLGAFGHGTMFVDAQSDGLGLRYRAIGVGETFIRENHQGIINEILRYYKLSGKQVLEQFNQADLPEGMIDKIEAGPDEQFTFINWVRPNKDLDPTRKDAAGMKFESLHVSVDYKWLVRKGGYHVFPYISSRYEQAPNEAYGRGPAMRALPAIRTLMSQKSVVLEQGHRAVRPIYLGHDDGVMDSLNMIPGAFNPGGVNADGRPLVHALETGNIQIGKDMMDQEREIINASFLVHLFQILAETPRMTATEVLERTREKGILLAPTVGRQQSEYLGPLVDREIDVLVSQGIVPPMPPELEEAQGEYQLQYNSPLARAMRAEEAAGIVRTLDHILPIIQTTGDPSPLDNFDMDVISREVSEIEGVKEHWRKSVEEVEEIRANRAAQQERAMQAQEAPGQAALMQAAQKGA